MAKDHFVRNFYPLQYKSNILQRLLSLPSSIAYGKNVQTVIEQPLESEPLHAGKNTVSYEARLLKSLLLRIA